MARVMVCTIAADAGNDIGVVVGGRAGHGDGITHGKTVFDPTPHRAGDGVAGFAVVGEGEGGGAVDLANCVG